MIAPLSGGQSAAGSGAPSLPLLQREASPAGTAIGLAQLRSFLLGQQHSCPAAPCPWTPSHPSSEMVRLVARANLQVRSNFHAQCGWSHRHADLRVFPVSLEKSMNLDRSAQTRGRGAALGAQQSPVAAECHSPFPGSPRLRDVSRGRHTVVRVAQPCMHTQRLRRAGGPSRGWDAPRTQPDPQYSPAPGHPVARKGPRAPGAGTRPPRSHRGGVRDVLRLPGRRWEPGGRGGRAEVGRVQGGAQCCCEQLRW